MQQSPDTQQNVPRKAGAQLPHTHSSLQGQTTAEGCTHLSQIKHTENWPKQSQSKLLTQA